MTVLGRDTTERLRRLRSRAGVRRAGVLQDRTTRTRRHRAGVAGRLRGRPHRAPCPIPLLRDLLDAAGPPPRGSRVTYEPGGQLELSSPAFPGATACWQALAEDAEHVRRPLAAAGLRLLPTAIDPYRAPAPPARASRATTRWRPTSPRPAPDSAEMGPVMMTSTAALQVNLDIGADIDDGGRRWRLLHTVGPTMVAAFANSPVHAGRDTGWKSARQRVWQHLDPARTSMPAGTDPATAWARLRPGRPR